MTNGRVEIVRIGVGFDDLCQRQEAAEQVPRRQQIRKKINLQPAILLIRFRRVKTGIHDSFERSHDRFAHLNLIAQFGEDFSAQWQIQVAA